MIEFLYKLRYRKENITLSEIFDTETITKFHHISITLRYLYIESYFSNNESGIDLYRNAHKNYYKYFKKYYDEEKDIKEFNSLIESIRNKGYDKKSAVYFDCNGNLYNGAHRVAICTYLGINSFTGYRINKDSNPLSPEECYKIFNTEGLDTILQNKYREIIENIQR